MMKRYAVEIEIETYATNRKDALSNALDVLANTDGDLASHCNRITAWVQETNECGVPLMTRKGQSTILSRGTR